jgi:crossover junction endodeoxyribonuclease RuvC
VSIILGIDPGSRRTGYGVVSFTRQQYRHLDSGFINLSTASSMTHKLRNLHLALTELFEQHQPTDVAIEQAFVHKNPRSALILGQARGAAIAAAGLRGLDVHEYSPRQVKLAVVGYGGAIKEQVQHMVSSLLKLTEAPQEDAADALAIAMTHCQYSGNELLAELAKSSRSRGRRRR